MKDPGQNKYSSLLKGKEILALIIVSAFFTAAGATIGLQEEVIALTPMLLLFGRSLGYKTYTTIYISYGSSVLGGSFSPSNPFAVMIAQKVSNRSKIILGLLALTFGTVHMVSSSLDGVLKKFLPAFLPWELFQVYLVSWASTKQVKPIFRDLRK